jgi:hypothetical protein
VFTRIFALFVLAFGLFVTQSRATTSTCVAPSSDFEVPPPPSCSNTFTPGGVTTGVYDFTATGDGKLIVSFDTILDSFTLTVTVNHTIDPIDFTVFPAGTACVPYEFNGGLCDQYDFTGNASGFNGVPVKGVDYQHLITLTLIYFTSQITHTPAFGHAPGDITTFTEDILTNYSSDPIAEGPTMGGTTPGLSSVVALDEPLTGSDVICKLTLNPPGPTYSAASTPSIEVTFQLYSGGSCPLTGGTPLREKTARFSLSYFDPTTGTIVFPPIVDKEEAGKFHWDNQAQLNEYDLSTVGLPTGFVYTITVFSNNASPQSKTFTLAP